MTTDVVDWVIDKLNNPDSKVAVMNRTASSIIEVCFGGNRSFHVGITAQKKQVDRGDILPFTGSDRLPQIIVNVPSAAIWTGAAISLVHSLPAAFGNLGDIARAARSGDVPSYRNDTQSFFGRILAQHSKVADLARVFDEVFDVTLTSGKCVRIALLDGYHVSAENVRSAREKFGHFDIGVKKSSYGSVTSAASDAAESMNSQVMNSKELLSVLGR